VSLTHRYHNEHDGTGLDIPDGADSADRERTADRARRFFDSLWNQGDYWKQDDTQLDVLISLLRRV
jgi:hypothetical protein